MPRRPGPSLQRASVVFWNVQRLFEPDGGALHHALSGSDRRAPSSAAVDDKISTIAAVLDQISERQGVPLMVGLAEIESSRLARSIADRVRRAALIDVDGRARDQTGFSLDGLNLSLLINTDLVRRVVRLRSHIVDRTFDTRDILEVDLKLKHGGVVSTFVNHWPSRLSGGSQSRRIAASHYLRSLLREKVRFGISEMWDAERNRLVVPAKSELLRRARHPVVVMGDFNDEVFDASIQLLNSTNDPEAVLGDLRVRGRTKKQRFQSYVRSPPSLLNPFWSLVGRGGSYYRSPRWRTYDQILLSRGFLERRAGLVYRPDTATVFDDPDVARPDGAQVALTNRGGKPLAHQRAGHGCSDHFPVAVSLDLR